LLAQCTLLISVLWAGWRFYATPGIFAYDPFGGYFPGTPYDENVAISSALLSARAYHLVAAFTICLFCAVFLSGPGLRARFRAARGRLRILFAAIVALAVTLTLRSAHARLGFFLDANDVARALGGERETEHFVLHYSPGGPFAKDLDLVAADHEFRYAQLEKLLAVRPQGKVHSFLFDSAQQKQALMGAGHTFVAKPWRREIYLQADGWPHPVLMHELAHVFAGAFGDPIFGASRRGIAFNVGLIEGVAVAASWGGTALTPHQVVKEMRAVGLQPPLSQVMSLSFLGLNASQAYNVAGSFCRYLVDKHGVAPLETVFGAGGSAASYERAYGQSFEALAAQWSTFIDSVEVPAAEGEVIRERLQRPSVFHKVCAHRLALEREAAQRAASTNDRTKAVAGYEEICAEDPDEPQNLADLMDAAAAAERSETAESAARSLARHPKASAPMRGRAFAMLGDLALQRGDLAGAQGFYLDAEHLPLDEGAGRLVTVKRLATQEQGPAAKRLREFLVIPPSARDPAVDLLMLSELVRSSPDRSLFHYLLARQLEARGRFDEAAGQLDLALVHDGDLPDVRFTREALRLLGRSAYRAGQRARARGAFERLAKDPNEAVRVEANDWIDRCEFRL
jgi:tetratricopeptide (TPR) repeat protein